MTEFQRLVAGIEHAIMFSENLIDEAYFKVAREQVFHFTTNHRRLLKAQLGFHAHLTGGEYEHQEDSGGLRHSF